MKIAYLYFAYKNPNLIKRTMDRLTGQECSFFVHIDGKINIDRFAVLRGENVFFTRRRITVHWAEFTGVDAILLLMREALAAPQRFDYFVLLSGSEYPLRSGQYIQRFFEQNQGWEFITASRIAAPQHALTRINTLRYPSTRPVLRFASRVLAKIGLARRNYTEHLRELEPYAGNTWWALSREACRYIVEFHKDDRILSAFLENTFAPEETYIHTILGNSPFKSKIRRNLLYEDWSPREGVRRSIIAPWRAPWHSLPAVLNEKHREFFETNLPVGVQDAHGSGELLFARKFCDENLALVDRVDNMIKRQESCSVWQA